MCIVCFFLGYFVCDVIGKCGFGREHMSQLRDEDFGDLRKYRLSSESLPEKEFGDYSVGSKQFRSSAGRLRSSAGRLRSESESESGSPNLSVGAYV